MSSSSAEWRRAGPGLVPVVIERNYPAPISLGRIGALDDRGQWCLSANRGQAVLHALSADGQRSICIYLAPDAEAIRRVADTIGGNLPTAIWTSTEHWSTALAHRPPLAARDGEGVIGLVDRQFDRPITFEEAEHSDEAEDRCFALHAVRFLRSYMSLDCKRMFCLYAAPDLEAIRLANRSTWLPTSDVLAVSVRDAG